MESIFSIKRIFIGSVICIEAISAVNDEPIFTAIVKTGHNAIINARVKIVSNILVEDTNSWLT
jgi:hypothetical protein